MNKDSLDIKFKTITGVTEIYYSVLSANCLIDLFKIGGERILARLESQNLETNVKFIFSHLPQHMGYWDPF